MLAAPDNTFADLIPGQHTTGTAPVYGAPDKPAALPQGWEQDPDNPGSIRPIKGGPEDPNAGGILSDQSKDFFAQQVLSGAPIPSIGYGKEAGRAKQDIMNRAAKMAGAQGMSGTDYAAQIAHYKAGTASIANMQKMHDTISQAERNALLDGQQYMAATSALPHQGGGPIFNTITQAWERYNPLAAGHDEIAASDAAYTTFINNYNRVVAGSPTGSGTMSDSSRKEAMDTMRNSLDPSQKAKAFAQMKIDMANRMDAINSVIADQYKNLTRRYDQYSVPDDPAQAQLPADWVKSHPDSLAALAAAGGGGSGGDNGGGGGGGDGPPGMSDLSPDQKQAYSAFLAALPTDAKGRPQVNGDQVGAFLTRLTGKTVTNGADIAKAISLGQGVSTTVQDTTEQQKVDRQIANENKLGLNENPATTLIKQGATLNLSDEAAGVGNALANVVSSPLTGKFDPVGSYQVGRDAERQRIADARQQLGYGGTALEFGGALASANPEAAVAALAPKAAAVAAGKAGAVGGALSGFGAGEGTAQSVGGAIVGGAAGGALGRYGGTVLNKVLPKRFQPPLGMAPDVADAADRQNVRLIRPMVDESALSSFDKLKGSETAGPIINSAVSGVLGDIESATARLGQGGNSANREAQGEALRMVAKDIQTAGREGSTAAYEAARQVQPDAMVDPATMRQSVDAKLSQLALRPNQNRAEIAALKRYRADLDKPLPLQEIRNMRTDAYDNVYGTASRTAEQRRADRFMMSTIDGANQDIEAALTPEALAAYKQADAQYRDNKILYTQAFKPLFGDTEGNLDRLSAEQIHDRFKRALNTNGRAIAGFMQRLPTEQARDLAATFAEKLGRSAPDAPFDAQTFLNQTKDFSPSAIRSLFGPGGEQTVSDLRLLSRRLINTGAQTTGDATRAGYLERQSWRQLARAFLGGLTGIVKSVGGAGAAGAGGAAGYVAGGIPGAAVAAGTAATIAGARETSRVLSARAMTNPRVARWLAQTADVTSHKAATEQTRKLGVIIAREPALARELQPVYDFLNNRVALPLAANSDQSGGGNDQQQ